MYYVSRKPLWVHNAYTLQSIRRGAHGVPKPTPRGDSTLPNLPSLFLVFLGFATTNKEAKLLPPNTSPQNFVT